MNKLFWLDMEMSGLDVETEVVIEVAAIITDLDFNEIETYEAIVRQPQHFLDNMDDWNKEHHGKSGLTAKVPFGKSPDEVERKLISLCDRHFTEGLKDPKLRPVLAGNSITQDRLFIDRYFLNFSNRLHYRMLDVSSWKIIFNNKFKVEYRKKNNHRALDDIRESMEELKYYLYNVKI